MAEQPLSPSKKRKIEAEHSTEDAKRRAIDPGTGLTDRSQSSNSPSFLAFTHPSSSRPTSPPALSSASSRADSDPRATLASLPPELLDKISEYLPASDVLRIAPTAKMFATFGYASQGQSDQLSEAKQKAGDVAISPMRGSRDQLKTLINNINQEVGLTALQAKILLRLDSKATPLDKQLQRDTYAEILCGRISLEQALEQIKQLEFSFQANENLSLMKVWSHSLPHWQKSALQEGLPWLSLIHYPHDPSCDGFFTAEEMRSDSYTLLHVEIVNSLKSGNYYDLSINVDRVKTCSVEVLVEALATPATSLFQRFYTALLQDDCVVARTILAVNPELLSRLSADQLQELQLSIQLGIQANFIASMRLLVGVMDIDLYQSWILERPFPYLVQLHNASSSSSDYTPMVHVILGALKPEQRLAALTAPLAIAKGISLLGMATMFRRPEKLRSLLVSLNAEQRLAAILTPQVLWAGRGNGQNLLCIAAKYDDARMLRVMLAGLSKEQCKTAILAPHAEGELRGQSAFSVAKKNNNRGVVALMEHYLTPSEMAAEVQLSSSSHLDAVGFFSPPPTSSTPAAAPSTTESMQLS